MPSFRELLAATKSQIREVDTAAADDLRRQPGAVVLDVREPDEYEQGAIPGAVHIPRGTMEGSVRLALAGTSPAQMLQTLTAIGLARMQNGELGPIKALDEIAKLTRVPALDKLKFDARQLPFRVERGRVATNDVMLHGPTGAWRLSGSVGFDGSLDYAASLTLPPSLVQSLGARSALALCPRVGRRRSLTALSSAAAQGAGGDARRLLFRGSVATNCRASAWGRLRDGLRED